MFFQKGGWANRQTSFGAIAVLARPALTAVRFCLAKDRQKPPLPPKGSQGCDKDVTAAAKCSAGRTAPERQAATGSCSSRNKVQCRTHCTKAAGGSPATYRPSPSGRGWANRQTSFGSPCLNGSDCQKSPLPLSAATEGQQKVINLR